MSKVRVRFAPSPTGYMHIGNFRTALYAYFFAKKNGGDFILRIEDTDKNRQVSDAIEKIISVLEWAGLDYEEGVFVNSKLQNPNDKSNPKSKSQNYKNLIELGDYGPYIQSERLDIYKKHAQDLLDKGQAYYCFCSPERLEKMREDQLKNKQAPMYDRECLKVSKSESEKRIKNGEPYVIRQKINTEGETVFEDLVRGRVKIKNELLDDQVLLKADGYPTYNFANVIDDHLMEITHVFRGEEYISSTPKYTQLYHNYGWVEPKIAHLPLILNPDKSKLSKRQGDVAVEDYIKNGYLKEAIINFVALLGWNPGKGETKEIFPLEELIEKFDLKHVHRGGAVFDVQKLDWINSRWIKDEKRISNSELLNRSIKFFEQKDFYNKAPKERKTKDYLLKVLTIERDRLTKLSEVGENNKFFFQDIDYDKESLRWKNMTDDRLIQSLHAVKKTLEALEEIVWTAKVEKTTWDIRTKLINDCLATSELSGIDMAGNSIKKNKDKTRFEMGELFWPLRVALTGEKKSPPPEEVAAVLGKDETLKRINTALEKLK